MKIIYFDCFSGVSGDMFLGALVDIGLPLESLKKELRKIPLKNYQITRRRVKRQGFAATHLDIKTSPQSIQPGTMISLIRRSRLDKASQDTIIRLIQRLAWVEAKVHGFAYAPPPAKPGLDLHELGSADTLIDIAGAVAGLKLLGIDEIYSSPLPLGRGFVMTDHGCIPVPAPATAELLKDFPVANADTLEELVTPTGALLITSLAKPMPHPYPPYVVEKVGYGAGTKDLLFQPNVLRVFLGSRPTTLDSTEPPIRVLETNLDNTTGEVIGYLFDRLFQAGARDVFTIPIQMKKSRPGILLKVIADEADIPAIEEIIFRETDTLGIRHYPVTRAVLERETRFIKTSYGRVRIKIGRFNGRVLTVLPEYEDCRRIAEAKNIPLKEIYAEIRRKTAQIH